MVTRSKHPSIHVMEFNGEPRTVLQTATARIYSSPKLLAKLDWLLTDPPEQDNLDDLRDLGRRIGR